MSYCISFTAKQEQNLFEANLWSKLHTVQDEKCESIQKCLLVPPRINKLIYASFSVYLCTVV